MSSVNTPLSMRHTNGTMRNGRGLLSDAKTYTKSLFSEKHGGKLLLFFPFFFYKQDNARRGSDFAFAVTMRLQMKALQMQFTVTLALNT